MLAAAAVALASGSRSRSRSRSPLAGASVGAVVSLAPETGGTVAASQLRNWSPRLPAARPPRPASATRRTRRTGYESSRQGLAATTGSRSSRTTTAAISASTTRSRAACTWTTRIATRFAYTDYLQLGARLPPGDAARALRRPRRRLGAEAHVAGLPGRPASTSSSSTPRSSRVAHKYFARAARPAAAAIEVEDGRRFLADERRPLGRDRRRRLLLGLDPVPPRDARVPRARRGRGSRRAASSSRTSSARSRGPNRGSSARCCAPTAPSSRPSNDPSGDRAGGRGPRRRQQHDPRRRRGRRAVEGVPARALARGSPRSAPGAPDLTEAIRDRFDEPISTADVPVLTDDYAPTDALLLLFG